MKRNRLFALATVIILISSLLAGCGTTAEKTGKQDQQTSQQTTQQTQVKETLPVLKHLSFARSFDPNTDPLAAVLEKLTGYKVEYSMLPAENADQKLYLELASGADIDSLKLTSLQYYTLANKGALYPLNELLDKFGPNLKKNITPQAWEMVTVNGKIYGVPQITFDPVIITALGVRQDILDKLGLKIPTKIDEFYNLLKKIKEETGIIPLTGNDGVLIDTIASAFGLSNTYVEKNGTLIPQVKQSELKEYLTFMNKLYKEGLIDPDLPVNKFADVTAKFTSGKAAMYNFSWWDAPSVKPALLKNFPDAKIGYIMALEGAGGKKGVKTNAGAPAAGAITKYTKNAEHVIKWFDAKLETEKFKEFAIGEENVHFKIENGIYKPILPKFNERANSDWYMTGLDVLKYPAYSLARVWKNPDQGEAYVAINAQKSVAVKNPLEFAPPLTNYSKFAPSLTKMETDFYLKVIAGTISVDKIDEFIKEWEKAGGLESEKEVNDWYKTAKK